MPDKPSQDKTEAPSTHRRQKAKDEGNVARSMELNSVIVLLAGLVVLLAAADSTIGMLPKLMVSTYMEVGQIELTPDVLPQQVRMVAGVLMAIIAPMLLTVLAAGLGVNLAQIGLFFAKKALIPKFNRIDPLKGFQRIFSLKSLVELVKGLLKVFLIGLIGYFVLMGHLDDFLVLPYSSPAKTIALIGTVAFDIAAKAGLTLLALSLADFGYQKWEYEKNLKMTKEEVKEETKQYEGSPETKSRVRSTQKQMARKRMMAAVPDATVVVANPVHLAIALKYRPVEQNDAPVVVAKGKRKIAERIKEIASQNGVPVVENRPLARELYHSAEVGMQIPIPLYEAVAEILAQVYQINRDRYSYMAD